MLFRVFSFHIAGTVECDSVVTCENACKTPLSASYGYVLSADFGLAGKTETKSDVLKSLMAIYLFRKKVADFTASGVNFRKHLYVPEDDEYGEPQHEREDHNHVLKRIGICLRIGYIPNVSTRAFVGAMNDSHTGLTYTALTGKRKQSVSDAEKLMSTAVAEWCASNGYPEEGRVVKLIADWHKASDGRGLSEDSRSKANIAMLDFLLEDWMPWNKKNRDYSTLDPNRLVKFPLDILS